MKSIAVISVLAFPRIAVAQEDVQQWKDWGSYQVIGVLSSESLLMIQDHTYFVCGLQAESSSFAIRNCLPAVTDSQVAGMQAVAMQTREDAAAKLAAEDAAQKEEAQAEAEFKQSLGALGDVSDDQFLDAFKTVLASNKCVLELEFSNLKNRKDLESILTLLGISDPINPTIEVELKKRSSAAIGNLYRVDQITFGELSKSIKLKDCS